MELHLGELAQFVTAIVLALNFYQSWRNGKKASVIANSMEALEKNTNSKMDQLVALTAKSSLAEGTAVGLAQGRSEDRTRVNSDPHA
jgi:hypothetical protein